VTLEMMAVVVEVMAQVPGRTTFLSEDFPPPEWFVASLETLDRESLHVFVLFEVAEESFRLFDKLES